MINYDIENELGAALGSGERLLWTGRPRTGIVFRPSDMFVIPFSLFWAGFAIFWESSVIRSGAPVFFALWGIPFLLVAVYLTIGRFFVDAYRRAKTRYGITGDRILISSGLFQQSLSSINISTLTQVTFTEKSDRSGSIRLGAVGEPIGGLPRRYRRRHRPVPTLELIDDVRYVYNMIVEQQKKR